MWNIVCYDPDAPIGISWWCLKCNSRIYQANNRIHLGKCPRASLFWDPKLVVVFNSVDISQVKSIWGKYTDQSSQSILLTEYEWKICQHNQGIPYDLRKQDFVSTRLVCRLCRNKRCIERREIVNNYCQCTNITQTCYLCENHKEEIYGKYQYCPCCCV